MSKKLVLPSLAVAVVAVITLFGVLNFSKAYAQTPTETPTTATETTSTDLDLSDVRDVDGPHGGKVGYSQQDLADALGIDLTKLQAATESANTEALKLAVEQGLITQAQADEITARGLSNGPIGGYKHLFSVDDANSGIDYNALLAEALGISTDQLTAAVPGGFHHGSQQCGYGWHADPGPGRSYDRPGSPGRGCDVPVLHPIGL